VGQSNGVEPDRLLLLRFSLLNFSASFRAFFLFRIFGKNINLISLVEDVEKLESVLKSEFDNY